jgi:excisionase family DNA binding protein
MMQPAKFDFDSSLEALADRVAAKLGLRLESPSAQIAPRLLTVAQAAVYIGRTKASVQHMVGAGILKAVRSDGRVFLDRGDLDEWIEQHKSAEV